MKFKIGDTVEVVKYVNPGETCALPKDIKKGHRGKIVEYTRACTPFPYKIERKNGKGEWFNAEELKLIRKGK